MNYIDLLLIIPLLWGIYKGFTKGLIIEVATLAALLLGIWGGVKFSDYAAGLLSENVELDDKYMPLVSFALTFVVIVVVVYVLGRMIEKVVDLVALNLVNKIAGSVFGLLKVGLILSVVLVIINSYDEQMGFLPQDMKEESILYQPMSDFAVTVVPALKDSEVFEEIKAQADSVNSEIGQVPE